ncbi:MAG: hypothetical protein ACHQAX_07910 [Gammaproteobacteria bacterium]
MQHPQTQKVTANLPIDLLKKAQEITGMGLTETIKIALMQLSQFQVYDNLRKMRGMVEFTIEKEEDLISFFKKSPLYGVELDLDREM